MHSIAEFVQTKTHHEQKSELRVFVYRQSTESYFHLIFDRITRTPLQMIVSTKENYNMWPNFVSAVVFVSVNII